MNYCFVITVERLCISDHYGVPRQVEIWRHRQHGAGASSRVNLPAVP